MPIDNVIWTNCKRCGHRFNSVIHACPRCGKGRGVGVRPRIGIRIALSLIILGGVFLTFYRPFVQGMHWDMVNLTLAQMAGVFVGLPMAVILPLTRYLRNHIWKVVAFCMIWIGLMLSMLDSAWIGLADKYKTNYDIYNGFNIQLLGMTLLFIGSMIAFLYVLRFAIRWKRRFFA